MSLIAIFTNCPSLKLDIQSVACWIVGSVTDITKCTGENCPFKDRCYRFTAKADEYRQAYFGELRLRRGSASIFGKRGREVMRTNEYIYVLLVIVFCLLVSISYLAIKMDKRLLSLENRVDFLIKRVFEKCDD